MRWRAWDNLHNQYYKPTYLGYLGVVEELFLTPSGDLVLRNQNGISHESTFPGRFEVEFYTEERDICEGDIVRLPVKKEKFENYVCVETSVTGIIMRGELRFYIRTIRTGVKVDYTIDYGPMGSFLSTHERDFYGYDGAEFSWSDLEVIGNIHE